VNERSATLPTPPSAAGHPVVAFVGNPNTGKTTLFNALAGMRQRVGNYPGVTVETKKGHMTVGGQVFDLIDLPGTYSLAPRSPDETVAVDLILGQQAGEPRPDVVVAIVDASNLDRNLYLTTQALELGVPVVLALNMIDLAAKQGIRLDAARLEKQLGIPVVPVQANKGKGLERLKEAIQKIADCRWQIADCEPQRVPAFPEAFEREVAALQAALGKNVPSYLVRRLLLDVGGYLQTRLAKTVPPSAISNLQSAISQARQRLAAAGCPVPAVEARSRYAWIREVTSGCVQHPAQRPVTWTDRLDRVLTHRVWGVLIFLALMFLVFQSIFLWATPLMDLIKAGKTVLGDWLRDVLPAGPLTSLLTGGVLEGVGGVLVFLPQIVILFAFIAVLEDCGYMARAAFLMDRLMARCGLNGKSFIPMLSSVACAVPGILATRVIENRRDRLATILVAPLMSCSARLPVYTLLIGAFIPTDTWLGGWLPGLTLFALYLLGLVLAPLVALVLKRTLLRGETPVFILEMPQYKRPSLRTVLRRVGDSGWAFVRRAGTLILASMIVVWALLYFPNTDPAGVSYETRLAALRAEEASAPDAEAKEAKAQAVNALQGEWRRQSLLGRVGRAIEPAVRPLGWDWKIGMAALASFPAREVVVGTLGIIYNLGEGDAEELRDPLAKALREATWDDDPGRPVFTVPVALSLMVFFALCCQCASTLAVIKRETNSWRWPAFTFAYMTGLAYVGALVTYQIGSLFG
jgi:ferrous iron transport protein B